MEKKTKQALIHVPTCVRFSVESHVKLVGKEDLRRLTHTEIAQRKKPMSTSEFPFPSVLKPIMS